MRTLSFALAEGARPVAAKVTLNGRRLDATPIRTDDRVLLTLAEEVVVEEGQTLEVKLTTRRGWFF